MVFAFVNLVFGIFTGLGRLGLNFPLHDAYIHHGAIMTGGFLGSLISLEKVIPLKRKYFLAVPLISAGSIVAFVSGSFVAGVVLLVLASIGLAVIYIVYLHKQYDLYLFLMLAGALCWFTGNMMLWNNRFYPVAFPWWMAFLLFTIVAERLELSRFLPVSRRSKQFLLFFLAFFLATLIIPFHTYGTYFSGFALVFISIWLMRYDIVRLNLRKTKLTRFTGYALLSGYIALLMDGIFLITLPAIPYTYDAIVHTFFLGFAFSMIFAHGPIILPGVLGLSVKPYHPLLYLPLIFLILSVFIRISADVTLLPYSYRLISGWLSAGSIFLYFILLLTTTILACRADNATTRQ